MREVVDRTETVLAIEALLAAQEKLDFRAPLHPGTGVARTPACGPWSPTDEDRPPADDIAEVRELLRVGRLAIDD